MHQNATRYHRI